MLNHSQHRNETIKGKYLWTNGQQVVRPSVRSISYGALLALCMAMLSLSLPQIAAHAHPLDPPGPRPTCQGDACTGMAVEQTNCANSDWATHVDTPITIAQQFDSASALITPEPGTITVIGSMQHWISTGCNAHWLTVVTTAPSQVRAGITCPSVQTSCFNMVTFGNSNITSTGYNSAPTPAQQFALAEGPATQKNHIEVTQVTTTPGSSVTTPMVGLLSSQDYMLSVGITNSSGISQRDIPYTAPAI